MRNRFSAASLPWATAWGQVQGVYLLPSGLKRVTASPAAKILGSRVCRVAETRRIPSSSRPEPSRKEILGVDPMARNRVWHGTHCPPIFAFLIFPSHPSTASRVLPRKRWIPVRRRCFSTCPAASAPMACGRSWPSFSNNETSKPADRRYAAVLTPTSPPPKTSIFCSLVI